MAFKPINNNGQIIIRILSCCKQPITCSTLVRYISRKTGAPSKDIREDVKATVSNGVRYGYIQRKGARFFIPQKNHSSIISRLWGRRRRKLVPHPIDALALECDEKPNRFWPLLNCEEEENDLIVKQHVRQAKNSRKRK